MQPGADDNIQHLVFDMGGVLVEIDWHGKISQLLGKDIPFNEIHALWAASPAVNDFEHGRSDFDTFTQAFIAEQELQISDIEFQREFMAIVIGEFAGVSELLASLQPHYTLSLLSNTNTAHWQHIVEHTGFLSWIDNPFTSIEFGLMKPDPAIYHRLIKELKCRPENILFFDDGLANVLAARAEGLRAEQVFGPEDIKRVLKSYSLTSSNG